MTFDQLRRFLWLLATAPLWLPIALVAIVLVKVLVNPDGSRRFSH